MPSMYLGRENWESNLKEGFVGQSLFNLIQKINQELLSLSSLKEEINSQRLLLKERIKYNTNNLKNQETINYLTEKKLKLEKDINLVSTDLEIIKVKEFDKTEYGYDNLLLLGGCKMPSNHFSKLEDELELLDDDNEEDEDEFMVKSIFRSKRNNETVNEVSSVANKRQLREMLGDDFFN